MGIIGSIVAFVIMIAIFNHFDNKRAEEAEERADESLNELLEEQEQAKYDSFAATYIDQFMEVVVYGCVKGQYHDPIIIDKGKEGVFSVTLVETYIKARREDVGFFMVFSTDDYTMFVNDVPRVAEALWRALPSNWHNKDRYLEMFPYLRRNTNNSLYDIRWPGIRAARREAEAERKARAKAAAERAKARAEYWAKVCADHKEGVGILAKAAARHWAISVPVTVIITLVLVCVFIFSVRMNQGIACVFLVWGMIFIPLFTAEYKRSKEVRERKKAETKQE